MHSDTGFSASKGRSYGGTVLKQLVTVQPFSLLCHHKASPRFQGEGDPFPSHVPKICPALLSFLRMSWEETSLGRSSKEEETPAQLCFQVCCIPDLPRTACANVLSSLGELCPSCWLQLKHTVSAGRELGSTCKVPLPGLGCQASSTLHVLVLWEKESSLIPAGFFQGPRPSPAVT